MLSSGPGSGPPPPPPPNAVDKAEADRLRKNANARRSRQGKKDRAAARAAAEAAADALAAGLAGAAIAGPLPGVVFGSAPVSGVGDGGVAGGVGVGVGVGAVTPAALPLQVPRLAGNISAAQTPVQASAGPSSPSANLTNSAMNIDPALGGSGAAPAPAGLGAASSSRAGGVVTSASGSGAASGSSAAVTGFDANPHAPLTARGVVTPGNNPTEFARRKKVPMQHAGDPRVILPGTGYEGPNVYMRCLMGLKSGLKSEQQVSLHHFVKISHERGEKFKFESFATLAEALTEKVLEVGSLFYYVWWEVSYREGASLEGINVLNGVEGTPDIRNRIALLHKKEVMWHIQTEDFADNLIMIKQAALTIRNMVLLDENAEYISQMWPFRDMLSIVLNLPEHDDLPELVHYILDITEEVTKYLHLDDVDPLYLSLLDHLRSDDRGIIIKSLRSLVNMSLNLDETNRLAHVPADTIEYLFDQALIDDVEMQSLCLDFFYQYTAVVDNVNLMLYEVKNLNLLTGQLCCLLSHGGKEVEKEYIRKPAYRLPGPKVLTNVPAELLTELLKLEEPTRSSQWLKSMFEEDDESSLTQIFIWQAYQARFGAIQNLEHPILAAAEFIKNISTTFQDKAIAQVQGAAEEPTYIIKGLRIREKPVDFRGKEFQKCKWICEKRDPKTNLPFEQDCDEWFMERSQMMLHIVKDHLNDWPRNEDGSAYAIGQPFPYFFRCRWNNCDEHQEASLVSSVEVCRHITEHTSQLWPMIHPRDVGVKKPPRWLIPAEVTIHKLWDCPVDENGEACGIPLTAALILRNLARNIPKTEADEKRLEEMGPKGKKKESWVCFVLEPHNHRFFRYWADCPPLAAIMSDILNVSRWIPEGCVGAEKRANKKKGMASTPKA